MIDTLAALMQPQMVVTLLAAIAAFATALTVLMPVLNRDRLDSRMQVMAIERDKMRAARLSDLGKKDGPTKLRTKLKMAGLRGQAPLVAYAFFRLAMPIIVAVAALFYLFVLTDWAYPPIVK